jgi:two-component system, OmpR family, response regulator
VDEPSLLVVEDDPELRDLLARGLREEGFAVETVATGSALLRRFHERGADALVIDVGLPDADGRDVCQALRAQGESVPVLFLTALDALPDRVAGFRAGGDDYVTKPFALVEVAERLRALLRRAGSPQSAELSGARLDPAAHAVASGDVRVPLTPTEFRLLAALLQRSGEAVRRRVLIEAGWPHGARVQENTLDAYIARLRRKLRELPDAPEIATVHGVGYAIR